LDKYLHYYGFGKLETLFWKGTRSAYNASDLALATSQAMVDLLRQQGLQRVELWQKGVDTETFSPDNATPEMREQLTQGHPEDKLMVYIGRLSAEKGIEACRPVLQAIPGLRLALIGDGPHRAVIEAFLASRALLRQRTLLTGEVRNVGQWLNGMDIFVLPSLSEGFSNTLLEAMAVGVPSVATAIGGSLEIIEHGRSGLLVTPRDVDGIANCFVHLAKAWEWRLELGRNARERIVTHFSLKHMLQRYDQMYCELMERSRAGRSHKLNLGPIN